ncbi:MAG TPA: fructose-specific PTS transporter subunit EIIC [Dermatophilaceae bacterium]|nr:fructose-specific PTS transporter subunit EIIC [Dermatophilaceae bacterium]
MSLITDGQVVLDLTEPDRHAATRRLAQTLVDTGRCTDLEQFIQDVREREELMATGQPGGLAIPHARSAAITEPSLVFGRAGQGIDWGAKDGPASLIFLIAAPADGADAHMQVLPKLARALMKKDFREALTAATTEAEVVDIVSAQVALDAPVPAEKPSVAPAAAAAATGAAGAAATTAATDTPAAAPAPATAATAQDAPAALRGGKRFVGVTSCPTGIAHTYMAAEALEIAAREAGHTMVVETQGSAGSTPLSQSEIDAADAVIFAHDLPVKDKARFAGKPTIDVGVKKAISDGPQLIAQAAAAADEWASNPALRERALAAASVSTAGSISSATVEQSTATKLRTWLMTGVSYMIPFVAAGGILIALGFMLAGAAVGGNGAVEVTKYGITNKDAAFSLMDSFNPGSLMHWAALLFVIGAAAFGFLVPILSGYIAYAIADRPGLVPGIVGGSIASTMGAGFLGGIVTGLLGGFVARWISGWKVHKGVRGVMPVVVVPLLSSLITLGLFITVLGRPIKALMDALTNGLNGLGAGGGIILGLIVGAMMGFDLGGPVNKVAYTFGTTGLASVGTATDAPQLKVMAAIMAAGMVAPLAMALATTLRPQVFTEAERENGRAAWLLGASFISEGAIPFAAGDPGRVIPSSLVGSAVTGALAMAFGTTLRAPHGGIWVLPLIGNAPMFVVAILVGVLVMTGIYLVLRGRTPKVEPASV